MNLDFSAVVRRLGADAAFTIANRARPGSDLLFSTLLPEINKPTYEAKSGTMTVRTTMAGLVGMDSNYPPTGLVEASTFSEQTAKVANEVVLSEQAQREIMMLLQSLNGGQQVTQDQMLGTEALNFYNKLVVQAHLDTAEYLRSEALVTGAIAWTMNGKTLSVDYGVPAGNFLTNRTGTAAYDGSASAFWDDIRALRAALKYSVRAFIVHPDTMAVILSNDANKLRVTAEGEGTVTVRRFVGTTEQLSSDSRDTVTFVTYDREGEVLDPSAPSTTIKVPFMPTGKILAIGNNNNDGYRVGMGATDSPTAALALGYTHIAPTVEGKGAMGRWGDLDTPADRPWQLRGRGVTNLIPVIEAPQKVAVASTDMP